MSRTCPARLAYIACAPRPLYRVSGGGPFSVALYQVDVEDLVPYMQEQRVAASVFSFNNDEWAVPFQSSTAFFHGTKMPHRGRCADAGTVDHFR